MDYVSDLHQRVLQKYDAADRVPIMLTGGFRTGKGVAAALQKRVVDIIGIARPFATEPDRIASLLDPACADQDIMLSSPVLHVPLWSSMDAGLQNLWHQRQIKRLALGQEPDPKMGVVYCLVVQAVFLYIVSPSRLTHLHMAKIAACTAGVIAFIIVSLVFMTVVR